MLVMTRRYHDTDSEYEDYQFWSDNEVKVNTA